MDRHITRVVTNCRLPAEKQMHSAEFLTILKHLFNPDISVYQPLWCNFYSFQILRDMTICEVLKIPVPVKIHFIFS